MILADKIINERKKNGWSQEELAEKLNVSRQAVSKWEGAQSVPDMQRILDMSRLFGVSTDYLLKDELEAAPAGEALAQEADSDDPLRRVSLAEAQEFLRLKHWSASRIALGVFLCLFGAAVLVFLTGLGEYRAAGLSKDACGVIGVIFLLLCIAGAVALFITTGQKLQPYEFLEKESFETEYGVRGMALERRNAYREKYGSYVVIGVALCILAVVPLLASALFGENEFLEICLVSILLLLVGAGVVLFILYGVHFGSVDILLQEGDYTAKKKKLSPVYGTVSGVYWLLAVAIFLAWSFLTDGWERTWIVWPVAGVLFPVVLGIAKLFLKDKD